MIGRVAAALVALGMSGAALAFDQSHAAWDALLRRHVAVAASGVSSRVDYAGMAADRAPLQGYLDGLASVTPAEYAAWRREQKLAFLINAYNAFTVQLVLTRYPDLASIKDLGSLLSSPWKKEFFSLLGSPRSLDGIEHRLIRAPGAFDEPRIHFAVNCASIGCPMLRAEAYVGERLESQLDEAARRFLQDRSRNRYDAAARSLEVSKLFDWYGSDFEKAAGSVAAYLARYADALADDPAGRSAIRQAQARVRFLDYDWALNVTRR